MWKKRFGAAPTSSIWSVEQLRAEIAGTAGTKIRIG
jgi:hypothetical protein